MTTREVAVLRHVPHFVLWDEGPAYDDRWIITDTRTAERLLQTRDERFARAVLRLMRTQPGWWD